MNPTFFSRAIPFVAIDTAVRHSQILVDPLTRISTHVTIGYRIETTFALALAIVKNLEIKQVEYI